jgi:hypothetical protein
MRHKRRNAGKGKHYDAGRLRDAGRAKTRRWFALALLIVYFHAT